MNITAIEKRQSLAAAATALQSMAKARGGIVSPQEVLEEARKENSPLHSCFTWDNSVAGERYRLAQARVLLRVTVQYLPANKDRSPTRVFVSLTPDRSRDGGYRVLADVLDDARLRDVMLADALNELGSFERKYKKLSELAGVFKAIRKVPGSHKPKTVVGY